MFQNVLTKNDQTSENRRRHDAVLDTLPPAVRDYVRALENDARQRVKAIRAETAKALQPLEQSITDIETAIATATTELDAATRYLEDAPATAGAPAFVEQYAIVHAWPARIDKLRADLSVAKEQFAQRRNAGTRDLHRVRGEFNREIDEVARKLSYLEIDVLRD